MIYTISQVNEYIRDIIEDSPILANVRVRGEVSNWTAARSGHCYFTLKDERAELRAVMWKSVAQNLPVLPRNGDEVVAVGNVSVYVERGTYQFYVNEMQPIGVGVLYQRFQALKQALAQEGLFDEDAKKPLPPFPQRIGIVTSPTAAALQDILKILRRRYPLVEVIISPTLVQGSSAPAEIVRAIRRFEKVAVSLILIARGGGSLEDLWAFNDEQVARAIYGCPTPIISGVGHEVDYTITDFVADKRAPTPSAAAELAVPDIRELSGKVAELGSSLDEMMASELEHRRYQIQQEGRALNQLSPLKRVREGYQGIEHLRFRLNQQMKNELQWRQSELKSHQSRLANLNPEATFARGYAMVADAESGVIIHSANEVMQGQTLHIIVEEGEFLATA